MPRIRIRSSWFRREFLSSRRLIFNICFYGLHCFFFAYGWYSQYKNKKLAALNTLDYSVWVSRGAGLVLAFDGGLILLPVLRNVLRVVRPKLAWLMPMDENIWFHRQVAYSMAFWTAIHVTAHYVNFINVERRQLRAELAVDIHYTQPGGITGHVMLTIMLLMYTTAQQKIRHQCFEAFWYTHHLAFFFFMALYTHATGCFVRDTVNPAYKQMFPFYQSNHCLGYESWRFIVWPFFLYFGERMWREIRARRETRLERVLVHPSGAVELRIEKPSFKFVPGQWVFVQVPTVSSFQWHPFSISSAPEDPYVSVTMNQVGDWTEQVGEAVGAGKRVIEALANATSLAEMSQRLAKEDFATRTFLSTSTAVGTPSASVVKFDDSYGYPPQSTQKVQLLPDDDDDADFDPRGPGGEPLPSDQFYEVVHGTGVGEDGGIAGFEGNYVIAAPSSASLPTVRIDGPYGAPTEDVFDSDLAVLVGAGIGATPFASILKHIWYRQRAGMLRKLRRVEFIWVCKDATSLAWFTSVLREIEDAQMDPNFLRISMYITQRVGMDQLYNIAINSQNAQYDPLTRLRSLTFFGRPDFQSIYRRLRVAIEYNSFLGPWEEHSVVNVGTFFCGPGTLAKTVKRHALACTTPRAKFTFVKEHF